MHLAFLGLVAAVVSVYAVAGIGQFWFWCTSVILGVVLWRERRRHPPRPLRVRRLAWVGLGNSVGFLFVFGWAIASDFANTKDTERAEVFDPFIKRVEDLVNAGAYEEASHLLAGCETQACSTIQWRIDLERGRDASQTDPSTRD